MLVLDPHDHDQLKLAYIPGIVRKVLQVVPLLLNTKCVYGLLLESRNAIPGSTSLELVLASSCAARSEFAILHDGLCYV